MSGKSSHVARSVALFTLVAGLGACSWFTDFKEQPKIDPWETAGDSVPMRGNPQASVPVYGSAAPGFAVSRMPMPATLDSMAGIANPVPADARSLHNGRLYYQINCAVCHGEAGGGFQTAPIGKFQGIYAPPLAAGSNAANLSDGYLWAIMRNGRGAMPSYNRIEELDRWDVVNYVRGLQGRYQVAVGPAGLPGETGDKVPGYSQTGPTRPSPYWVHAGSQADATRGMTSTPGAAGSTSPTAPDAARGAGGEAGLKAPSAQVPDSTATIPPVTARPARPTVPATTTPTTTPKTGGER